LIIAFISCGRVAISWPIFFVMFDYVASRSTDLVTIPIFIVIAEIVIIGVETWILSRMNTLRLAALLPKAALANIVSAVAGFPLFDFFGSVL